MHLQNLLAFVWLLSRVLAMDTTLRHCIPRKTVPYHRDCAAMESNIVYLVVPLIFHLFYLVSNVELHCRMCFIMSKTVVYSLKRFERKVTVPFKCVVKLDYIGDHFREFREEKVLNYSTMLLREDLGLLMLGARDNVYALDIHDISSKMAYVRMLLCAPLSMAPGSPSVPRHAIKER